MTQRVGNNMLKQAVEGITLSYDSAPTSWTGVAGTAVTFAHGLGIIPKIVWLTMECTDDDFGYLTGQTVYVPIFQQGGIGVGARVGTTNIDIIWGTGSETYGLPIMFGPEGGGTCGSQAGPIDVTKWTYTVHAMA